MRTDFYIGKMFDAWTHFGAHPVYAEGELTGVRFTTYAPAAAGIDLIGEFNGWQYGHHHLQQQELSGVWTVFVPEARPGQMYKYVIYTTEGWSCEHTDPYAFAMELRPASASIIVDLDSYQFSDADWMSQRDLNYERPMSIYELHAGSWKTNPDDPNGWYNFRQLADQLIPYLKEGHFTHLELLPITEHPADESWGYQVSGFYSVTARYGKPDDLKYLVDQCHQNGIGVIMDFVPVHFALDPYGLAKYDGTALYEYPSNDTGYSEWGSCNFNYYRGEVCSFLQSAADFWIDHYHVDGLRMDAISNVLYWQGDASRGVNEGAVNFLREMNAGLKDRHPGVMLIAEDSSNYVKVTAPVQYGGLGFDYKWDMGWMNDTLEFFRSSYEERQKSYHKLSFSMMYFYRENYILALSHDEVTHGKATIIQKMYGDYDIKFPQARALYTYMFTHPGKKLNFMGNEWAHFREWHAECGMDWDLLSYPLHDSFLQYMKKLGEIYTGRRSLYEKEYAEEGFRWLEVDRPKEVVYVYERIAGDDRLVVVLNLSPRTHYDLCFGYDRPARLVRLLTSDEQPYGGQTPPGEEVICSEALPYRGRRYRFTLNIPGYTAIIYEVKDPVVEGGKKSILQGKADGENAHGAKQSAERTESVADGRRKG